LEPGVFDRRLIGTDKAFELGDFVSLLPASRVAKLSAVTHKLSFSLCGLDLVPTPSIDARTWPACTTSPSLNPTDISWPSTRDLTVTVLDATTAPNASKGLLPVFAISGGDVCSCCFSTGCGDAGASGCMTIILGRIAPYMTGPVNEPAKAAVNSAIELTLSFCATWLLMMSSIRFFKSEPVMPSTSLSKRSLRRHHPR
jgi:hypothetical protein